MASNRMARREDKRIRANKKYDSQLKALRQKMKDPNCEEDKFEIIAKIESFGRDACRTRQSNRCAITKRARGVDRLTGLCRHEFRIRAQNGEIPGVVMASW